MYKIDIESLKKLAEINNSLNLVEVKGYVNIGLLYGAMVSLQQIIQKIENEPIIIDNSKGG
jgi:hypothetical protein